MQSVTLAAEKKSNLLINIISIVVPLAVAAMLAFPDKVDLGKWTKNLPHIIGAINFLTTLILICGFVFIKLGKVHFHRAAMTAAFCLGGFFLVCYVTYHISNPANKFSGEGFVRPIYFFTLITHVGLSLVVLPLVLRSMFYAVTKQFESHKGIVKYAYPIWLYVSISGVVVYLLLYQFFPSR